MNQSIKDKIHELFISTPSDVSVGYGKKITNGEYTGEIGFVFNVEKKKPLNEIPENEILPTSVEIDGVTYITDVFERGKLIPLACGQQVLDNCYGWQTTTPTNQTLIRPIKGGVQITSDNIGSYGTLGFIAVDNETNALVGVTNAHVVIGNPFFTTNRNVYNEENEINNPIYQPGNATPTIGSVIRYNPLKLVGNDSYPNWITNYVDGALISVSSDKISFSESFKQHGLPYNQPMTFATTSEIDNLLTTNPPIYSSGRTTGAKFGDCGLTIQAIGSTSFVSPYPNGTSNEVIYFSDIIDYTRINPDCEWPIKAGDSGSALIADFNGTCKIIGLAFAGGYNGGAACRIDRVAQELNISAWDGSSKPFIDLSSKTTITTTGSSSNKTIQCGGKTYWQVGKMPYSNPCV